MEYDIDYGTRRRGRSWARPWRVVTGPASRRVVRPMVRRFGKKGALVLLGIPVALLIGSGAYASLLLSSGGGGNNLQDGLVAWWKLDGNTTDSTIYNDNGALQGGAGYTSDRNGGANKALNLTTAGDFDEMDNVNNAARFDDSDSFSLSAWIDPTAVSGLQTIIGQQRSSFIVMQLNGSKLRVALDDANTASTGNISAGTWQHVAMTYDGSTHEVTLYINGQADGPPTVVYDGTGFGKYANWYLGYESRFNDQFLGGIDDARIYNRVLSSSEVSSLYSQYGSQLNAASGEQGLIGRWRMNGSPMDSTPYAHNGTINGSPAATTDRQGTANGAYSFNGSTDYLQMSGASFFNVDAGQSKTYSIWFKGATPAATEYFYWEQGACIGWQFSALSSGRIQFGLTTGNSGCTGFNSYTAQTTTSYTDNQWHLATAVVDRPGGNEYLYIDGALKATHAVDNTFSGIGGTFRIGTNWNNSAPFTGSLADARIYNRALTQTDITRLYDSYNSQINLYSSAGSGGGGANIASGLLGEWNFAGNAKDATPYSNNGTVTSATLTSNRFGTANGAYSFNGTSALINAGNITNMNSMAAATVAAWVKTAASASGKGIVTKDDSGSNRSWAFLQNGAKFRFNPKGNVVGIDSASNITDNNWHLLVGTYDGSTGACALYLDGALDASGSCGTGTTGTGNTPVEFGARNGGDFFTGSIDDVRIYNRALSLADVQALYNLPE